MSPLMMLEPQAPQTGEKEEENTQALVGHRTLSPATIQIKGPRKPFVEQFEKNPIIITTKTVSSEIQGLMEGEAGQAIRHLFDHYRGRLQEIRGFLREKNINKHGPKHQARVTAISRSIAHAFQKDNDKVLSDKNIAAVSLSGLGHDLYYEPKAHVDQDVVSKRDLDYHPIRGARAWAKMLRFDRFDADMEAADFCPINEVDGLPNEDLQAELDELTAGWTDEQKEAAVLAVLHHSNGSLYDRNGVPLVAKVLRLADKLDMENRVDNDRIVPDIRETDKEYRHRIVPRSIYDMQIHINKANREFNVHYYVDTTPVSDVIGTYPEDEFIIDFDRAYEKAMERAAEVVHSLFEHEEGELIPDEVRMTVTFVFPDGHTRNRQYIPELNHD